MQNVKNVPFGDTAFFPGLAVHSEGADEFMEPTQLFVE